ncbi:MAG: hypothetical protein LQ350_004438 [Teloschistes chrysophthalmus]|nr:MAG: hypothetical protein LQ350_004438 [Niorma chrysophthalma]
MPPKKKTPAPPAEKTAASSRRKRGESPEKGVDDLEPITKRTKTSKSKAKAASQPESEATSQPKPKATSKSKPTAKVSQSDLPRVVPTANASLPSPHSARLEPSDMGDKEILGLSISDILLKDLRLQYELFTPVWADDGVGKAFARCMGPGTTRGTEPTADDSTAPVISETWIQDHGFISWESIDLVKMPRNSRVADRKKANAPRARHVVEVFRENDEEDRPQFYMRYEMPVAVKVNGDLCTHTSGDGNFAIGPLPEYAIIEIDTAVIFWWKSEEGVEYLPEDLIMRKRLRDEDQGLRATTDRMAEEREEWGQILKRGIHDAQARRTKYQRPENIIEEWQTIPEIGDLVEYHVFLATASIWKAQRSDSARIRFAFGGMNQQQQMRRLDATQTDWFERSKDYTIKGVVDGPADLILPLVYPGDIVTPPSSATRARFLEEAQQPAPPAGTEEGEGEGEGAKQEKEKGTGKGRGKGKEKAATMEIVGHTVFAVAHRRADGTIETRLMDSCPNYWDSRATNPHDTVRKLVERSGWLARDRDGYPQRLPTVPQFEEVNLRVPRQGSGQNSCSIHAILNAWRYMLELPELNNTARSFQHPHSLIDRAYLEESFMNEALLLINLTIDGHMDRRTIQAFMIFHGFCGWQGIGEDDLSTRLIPAIDAYILEKELKCDQHDFVLERGAQHDTLMRRLIRAMKEDRRLDPEGQSFELPAFYGKALLQLQQKEWKREEKKNPRKRTVWDEPSVWEQQVEERERRQLLIR